MNSGENELPSREGDPGAAGIPCRGCGKRLASSFVFCPHCGAPLAAMPANFDSGSANGPGASSGSKPGTYLDRTQVASSPPIPGQSVRPNEEIVELDEVAFEEVIVCWRCDLNNPSGTRDCIHCEASLKVAGGKKKGARKSSLSPKPASPGRLPSRQGPAPRSPAVAPPFPLGAARTEDLVSPSDRSPRDLSAGRESPAPTAMPAPSAQRPTTGPLPFQAPSRRNLTDEIEILDDSEVAILPEGEALDSNSVSRALVSGQSARLGPVRDGSFKATVYSRKSSKPGKIKTEVHRNSRSHILFPVLVGYALMLAMSIAMYVAILIAHWMKVDMPPRASIWVEFLDTLVVLWLVFHCKLENFGGGRKVFAWVSAIPALAALYSGNIIIADWVRRMLGYEDSGRRADGPGDRDPITFYEIVTTSIQPGVIEELYCRHLLQGSLQKLTGPHAAIWVAAAMFALLHLYNPLGVPYLFLCGLVLGYYRYWSGSLVLPMTMHALHNFAVMIGATF